MRILFISPVTEKIDKSAPPLGLAWVVAATKEAGHRVEMLDLKAAKDSLVALEKTIGRFNTYRIGLFRGEN